LSTLEVVDVISVDTESDYARQSLVTSKNTAADLDAIAEI